MSEQDLNKSTKRTFWMIALFYGLIAFEFFYMASPFALYFYSAYRPGLNFLLEIPGMAWLTGFFLPHIVIETSSPIINLHNIAGAILTLIGFIFFCITAAQVYYAKIFKKGIVTGGIYHFIRHPQYTAFAICSFGLLLLWPRFLVLIMFIFLLFAYNYLARAEEQECEKKFGQSYLDYIKSTNMFLPFRIPILLKIFKSLRQKTGPKSYFSIIGITILVLSLGLATALKSFSLKSLYTYSNQNSIYLSVTNLDQQQLKQIADIALQNDDVQSKLDEINFGISNQFLNYVVPAEWYISEIPMHVTESDPQHFLRSARYKKNTYKIIFSKPYFSCNCVINGKEIIGSARKITPILEVWVDLTFRKVIDIKAPPINTRYENVPVPVY